MYGLGQTTDFSLEPEARSAWRKAVRDIEERIFGPAPAPVRPPTIPGTWPTWLVPAALIGGAALISMMVMGGGRRR